MITESLVVLFVYGGNNFAKNWLLTTYNKRRVFFSMVYLQIWTYLLSWLISFLLWYKTFVWLNEIIYRVFQRNMSFHFNSEKSSSSFFMILMNNISSPLEIYQASLSLEASPAQPPNQILWHDYLLLSVLEICPIYTFISHKIHSTEVQYSFYPYHLLSFVPIYPYQLNLNLWVLFISPIVKSSIIPDIKQALNKYC